MPRPADISEPPRTPAPPQDSPVTAANGTIGAERLAGSESGAREAYMSPVPYREVVEHQVREGEDHEDAEDELVL